MWIVIFFILVPIILLVHGARSLDEASTRTSRKQSLERSNEWIAAVTDRELEWETEK